MTEPEAGWGSGTWGDLPWGDSDDLFAVLDAVTVRENVIRVEFNQAVYLSGYGDLWDAGDPTRWAAVEDASTVGVDGNPARPVRVVQATLAPAAELEDGEFGRMIDLALDRPLTPWPASYVISFSQIYNFARSDSASGTTAPIPSTYRAIDRPAVGIPQVARDIANPQTLAAAASNPQLGTYAPDDSGDYAIDAGDISLKKRIVRRLITRPGAFGHLSNYGVGILQYVKQLATVDVRSRIAVLAEEQIAREPEVSKCRVVFAPSATQPGLYFLRIYVRTRQGLSQRFDLPLAPSLAQAA